MQTTLLCYWVLAILNYRITVAKNTTHKYWPFAPVIVMQQDNQYLMDILLDILWAAQRVETYTAKITLADFYADVHLQDKVIRRLLSISKNAKRISADNRYQIGAITWHIINRINAQLLEDDPCVDVDQLWKVTENEVPRLIRVLDNQILSQQHRKEGFSFAGAS